MNIVQNTQSKSHLEQAELEQLRWNYLMLREKLTEIQALSSALLRSLDDRTGDWHLARMINETCFNSPYTQPLDSFFRIDRYGQAIDDDIEQATDRECLT